MVGSVTLSSRMLTTEHAASHGRLWFGCIDEAPEPGRPRHVLHRHECTSRQGKKTENELPDRMVLTLREMQGTR
jgi:hypothetical protein